MVIADDTRRLIGGLFDYEDLGAVTLKGFATPVCAWRVLREGKAESRFEAFHASALMPLVAREEELELLVQHWQRAKTGNGHVVLLAGEPGIGKSRLIAALQERIKAEPHTGLRYFCSPHHQDSALYPFIAQLQRTLDFEREETPEHRLTNLAALLSTASPPDEDIAILADLLSIPTGQRYPADCPHATAKENEDFRCPVSAA